MPNGGVPARMLIEPDDGRLVFLVDRGRVHVYDRDEWRRSGRHAALLSSLDEGQVEALTAFLSHWASGRSRGVSYGVPGVSYDW